MIAPEKAQMNSVAIGNAAKAFGYQNTALVPVLKHDTNSLAVGIMAIGKGNYATALENRLMPMAKKRQRLVTGLEHMAIMPLLLVPTRLPIP